MANFMQKERIEVQGSGAYGAENLSKDLFSLMGAISGTVKAVDRSMVSESKDIGEALARDSILEMVRKKNAYDQQIAENPNDFDYQSAKNDMDIFVAQKMSDIKDRLGSDSTAYKAFEDGFLMNGTKYTEEYKTDLFQKYQTVERKKGIESEMQVVNETVNALGSEGVTSSYKRFKQLGLTDEQSSKYYTDTFLGKFQQAELDPKRLYDGATINRQREIAEFNKYYGSIATMNKDGSIEGKHGFLQQDDLGKIKQSWESKTKITKEKNERNIGFHLAVDEAMHKFKTFLPNTPEEATRAQEEVFAFVDAQYNQASSPSPADQEKYLKFKQDIRQANEDFNIAYGVATSDAPSIGKVIATGQNNLRQKVDTTTVKRLVTNGLDGMLNKALEIGDVGTIKKVVSLEGQSGVSSTVTSKFNTLTDFNKAKTIQEAETNLKGSLMLIDGGYSHGNEKMNKEMVEDYLTIISEGKIAGSSDDAIRIKLNEKKNDHILNATTKSPEYLQANQITLNRLTADDTKLQSLLGFGASIVAGEVKVNRGTKGNSFQEFGNALAKTLQNAGIRLDSNRPADEGDNLEKIKNSGYVYVIDNPFWNAEVVLLPDVVSGSVKRPISGEVFFDGVKKSVSVIKGIDFDSVDMEKVRTEPINTPNGLQTRVYYDNVVVKTFSGNELQMNYKTIDEKKLTKATKMVSVDSQNYQLVD